MAQQQTQQYKVAKDFTDSQGRNWKQGDNYQVTDESEAQRQEQQGNLKKEGGQQSGQPGSAQPA